MASLVVRVSFFSCFVVVVVVVVVVHEENVHCCHRHFSRFDKQPATKYVFDLESRKWQSRQITIRFDPVPFAVGGLRRVHHLQVRRQVLFLSSSSFFSLVLTSGGRRRFRRRSSSSGCSSRSGGADGIDH